MKLRLISAALLGLALALGALPAGYAAPGSCYLEALRELARPKHDSAVELELDTVPEVMGLITTVNGKVSGLFGGKPVPKWFKTWAKGKYPKYKNAGDIPWEQVPLQEQSDLINTASDSRGKDFHEDRLIHGLTTRDTAILVFDEPTVFLGKTYPKGRHEIDISKFLAKKVEYRGPDDVKAIGGVELHFRGPEASGDLSRDARTLQWGLGLDPTGQHLHMVTRLPVKALKARPELEAAKLGDFVRRANLAAEMVDIVHDGGGIAPRQNEDAIYFGSFSAEDLHGVTNYFLDVAHGENPAISDQYKMGWVGMRGSDKYDQPGLWGLEYRAIHRESRMATHRPVLNGLQFTMAQPELGFSADRFEAWFNGASRENPAERVSSAWYNQSWYDLFLEPRTPEARKALQKIGGDEFQALAEHAGELKMLLFDWSKDPLFFDQPAKLKSIAKLQARGLVRLSRGEAPSSVMRDFLLDSGIYQDTLLSIGVRVSQ